MHSPTHDKCTEVLHNSCNMSICVLPDMSTLIPLAYGPQDSGVRIRQNTHIHVTTTKYMRGRIKAKTVLYMPYRTVSAHQFYIE